MLCAAALARAEIIPATLFRDGAILQEGKPVPVWGRGDPGEKVTVSFGKQVKRTETGADGWWRVMLGSLKASSDPAQLVIAGKNTVTVNDILVGEVWLCSGQSNMAFTVRETRDAKQEIAAANHPLIRHFIVSSPVADKPFDAVSVRPIAIAGGHWETCSPATVAHFTAAGYFFARELQPRLGVPVGLVMSTLGGSPIEGWISSEALASDPAFHVVGERWEVMRHKVKGKSIRNEPSGLYNGLIYPLEPFSFAGVLWYQGEGNAPRHSEYARLFSTMIRQWRRDLQQEELPFIFVQLPNWGHPTPVDPTGMEWAWQREAQASVLTLPQVYDIVTLDIGDKELLHPTNKQEVGRRLALVALHHVYDQNVVGTGPKFNGVRWTKGSARVSFTHAEGLHFSGNSDDAFVLAGADRRFVPAHVRIDGDAVIVAAEGLDHPTAVRFEWCNNPNAFLVNDSGLPAAPFRSDDWPASP